MRGGSGRHYWQEWSGFGGACNAATLANIAARASPPLFLDGSKAPRGRPDQQNDRFSINSLNPHRLHPHRAAADCRVQSSQESKHTMPHRYSLPLAIVPSCRVLNRSGGTTGSLRAAIQRNLRPTGRPMALHDVHGPGCRRRGGGRMGALHI